MGIARLYSVPDELNIKFEIEVCVRSSSMTSVAIRSHNRQQAHEQDEQSRFRGEGAPPAAAWKSRGRAVSDVGDRDGTGGHVEQAAVSDRKPW